MFHGSVSSTGSDDGNCPNESIWRDGLPNLAPWEAVPATGVLVVDDQQAVRTALGDRR